ncbi:hypothetical protein SNEBB_006270 [Seison nebaliae]|nr:hypothetical protein SNEBB_006270 [Seison nebaliae]
MTEVNIPSTVTYNAQGGRKAQALGCVQLALALAACSVLIGLPAAAIGSLIAAITMADIEKDASEGNAGMIATPNMMILIPTVVLLYQIIRSRF